MPIKARPFKTQIGDVEVEGLFEDETFVFRFYGLVTFQPPLISIEEDAQGKFANLQETEISHPDGFVLIVATQNDPDLGCEWGYQLSLRRIEEKDGNLIQDPLNRRGTDIDSILMTRPRQLTSVSFNPNGLIDGSAQLEPIEGGEPDDNLEVALVRERVRSSAARRILFLSHA